MSVKTLSVELNLDDGKFTLGMRNAKGEVQKFTTEVKKSGAGINRAEKELHGFRAGLRDYILIIGQARNAIHTLSYVTTRWVSSIVTASAEMQRMTKLMEGMSDATSTLGAQMDAVGSRNAILEMAKRAPFAISALSDSYVKLKSAGIDPLNGSLQSLVDGVANFGGTSETLHRASIAIQQMAGKGVISMEELRQQLGEAIPRALPLLARAMNLTVAELVDKISRGTVEARTALSKLFDEFNRTFGGSAQALMETYHGQMARLQTSWTEFSTRVAEGGENGGFLVELTNQIQDLSVLLDSSLGADFAEKLGSVLQQAVHYVGIFANGLIDAREQVLEFGQGLAIVFGTRLVVGWALSAASAVGKFATVMSGITMKAYTDAVVKAAGETLFFKESLVAARIQALSTIGVFKAVGTAFTAILGPAGIIIFTIYEIASAFGIFTSAAGEAEDALERFKETGELGTKGFAAVGEHLKDLADDIEEQSKRVADAQAKYLEAGGANAYGRKGLEDKLIREQNLLQDLLRERARYQAAYDEEEARQLERAVEKRLRILSGEHAKRLRVISRDYDREQEAIRAQRERALQDTAGDYKAFEAAQKSLNEESLASKVRFYEAQEAVIQESVRDALAKQEAAAKQGNKIEAEAQKANVETLRKSLEEMRELRVRALETARSANAFITKPDDGSKKSPIQKRIDALTKGLEVTKAKAREAGTELAKLNADIEAGKYNGSAKIAAASPEDIQNARALATELDRLKQALEDQKTLKTALTTINGTLAGAEGRVRVELEESRNLLKSGIADPTVKSYRKLVETLDLAIGKFQASTAGIAEADKELEGLIARRDAMLRGAAAARVNQLTSDLRTETNEIRTSLMSQSEARQYQYDLDMSNMRAAVEARIALAGQETNETRQLREQYYSWVEQRNKKLKQEEYSTLISWSQTAMDIGQNIQQAATGWISSFAQDLASGEFSFKKFARSILAMITQIIIQATVARMVMAAIGYFGGGAPADGGVGAVTPTLPDAIGQPAGIIPAPVFHTGGMVGETPSMARMVAASMFDSAKRYHTGGMVGGRFGGRQLASDEVPIIAQRGEAVLTADQLKGLGAVPNIQINLINNSGTEIEADQGNSRFDGRTMILDVVVEAIGRPGRLREAIKGAR